MEGENIDIWKYLQILSIQPNVYTILFSSPTTYTFLLNRIRVAEQLASLYQLEMYSKVCRSSKAL